MTKICGQPVQISILVRQPKPSHQHEKNKMKRLKIGTSLQSPFQQPRFFDQPIHILILVQQPKSNNK
jgi:hypothetical protein